MYLKNNFKLIVLIAIIIFIFYCFTNRIEKFTLYKDISKNLDFDLDYINRRKCIIAISIPGNNTYNGTKEGYLGTIQKNKNETTAYQPSTNNKENKKYDTVFLYTGTAGSVSPNNVSINTVNGVDFLPTWEIINYSCNKNENTYLIRNVETDRLLSCGKITKNAPSDIAFLTEKNSITPNNLWEIKKVGVNEYTIRNISENLFLFSTKKNTVDFVTNTYEAPFDDQQYLAAPEYNNYGQVGVHKDSFNWFIVPLPPQNGVWRQTSYYLGSDYNNKPSAMEPCVPLENKKEIVYPWYKNSIHTINVTNAGENKIYVSSTNTFIIGDEIQIVSLNGNKENNFISGISKNLLELKSPLRYNHIQDENIYNLTNPDIKNNSICIKNLNIQNFYLQKYLNPVYILGDVGMQPWGECPGFKNQSAKWIWYTQNANINAPSGGKIFVYIYDNNQNLSNININCIADDQSQIKVNNNYIGTQKGGYGGPG